MARNGEELNLLFKEFQKFWEKDLQCPFNKDMLIALLEEGYKVRVREFIRRRLGHIPDVDYHNFLKLVRLAEPVNPKPPAPIAEPRKPAVDTEKIVIDVKPVPQSTKPSGGKK